MSFDLLRIRSGQQIYRSIQLPMRGKVLVRTGQRVEVGDVIAEYVLPERFMVYDLINGLKLNPDTVDTHVERLVGEHVEAGDVIAQKSGLFARIFRAPQEGEVVSIRNGKVTLALGEKKYSCSTNFPGTVVELIPERGAVIGGLGTVLQGVWGNGQSSQGDMVYLGSSDEHPFDRNAIDASLQGKILALGACGTDDLLDELVEKGAAGLIVSSLVPSLQPRAQGLEIPLMSLAGFGDIQMDQYSEEMIFAMMGRQVFLNAYVQDLYAGLKPEVILPTEEVVTEGLFEEENRLRVGTKVRLIGKPYTGSVGVIIELPVDDERFASGLCLKAAVVQRLDDQIIRIPLNNLEIIVD